MNKYVFTLSLLLSTGCATVFKGSNQTVNFSSDQTDTKVYINGQYMGKAPLELPLNSSKTYTVEFKKEGYENKTVVLNTTLGAGWVVLDVLGGLVPIVVDAATGNWVYLEHDNVVASLDRK